MLSFNPSYTHSRAVSTDTEFSVRYTFLNRIKIWNERQLFINIHISNSIRIISYTSARVYTPTEYRPQGIPSQTAESTRSAQSRSIQYAPVTVSIPYRAGSFSCIQTSKAPPNIFSHFSPSPARSPFNNSITSLCYIPSSFFCPRGLVIACYSLPLILFPFPPPVHRSPSCSVPCCPGRHRGPPFAPLLLSQLSRAPSLFLLRPSCAPQNGVTLLKLVCPWLGPWWMDARPHCGVALH